MTIFVLAQVKRISLGTCKHVLFRFLKTGHLDDPQSEGGNHAVLRALAFLFSSVYIQPMDIGDTEMQPL